MSLQFKVFISATVLVALFGFLGPMLFSAQNSLSVLIGWFVIFGVPYGVYRLIWQEDINKFLKEEKSE